MGFILWLVGALGACTVPSLPLEGLACDSSHPCTTGYACVQNVCVATGDAGAPGDFSLSVSPATLNVNPGVSAQFTVSTQTSSGAAQSVALAVSGLPAGVTASFNPASVMSGGSSVLTLTVGPTTAAQSAAFTVTGRGTASHSASGTLNIVANGFSLSLTPSSRSTLAPGSVTYTVSTAITTGVAQSVTLAVSGLPSGVTGTFSPTAVTSGGSSTLTLTVSSAATPQTVTFTVTGTGTITQSATSTLTVTAPTFSISASPTTVNVNQGGTATSTISTAVTSGQAQTVALSASGLPSGVTASFSPTSVTAGNLSTLTFTASAAATPGTATVTVTGTGTYATHTTTISLTVVVANTFSLAVSPGAASLPPGGTGRYTVTSATTSGAAQTVALSVSGLPSGVSGSFSPASITSGQSSTLTVTVASSAALSTGSFTVTGTGTSSTNTATGTLLLIAAASGTPLVSDTFTRSDVATGWGTATDGNVWTTQQGGGLSVSNNEGIAQATSVETEVTLGTGTTTNAEGLARFTLQAPTNDGSAIILRFVDTGDFYIGGVSSSSGGVIQPGIYKEVSGTRSQLAAASGVTLSASQAYWMRFNLQTSGGSAVLSLKVWPDGTPEPSTPSATFTDASPGVLATAGGVGMDVFQATAGNLWNLDNFSVGTLP